MKIGQVKNRNSHKVDSRVLGNYSKGIAGPLLVCFCGIHGNEPSGVVAFKRVLQTLKNDEYPIHGRLVGLAGNLSALKAHQRFIDKDMNRIWTHKRMQEIEFGTVEIECSEDNEQLELLEELNQLLTELNNEPFFIDLHTTSSESQPYISINDTLRNRRLAMNFPLPIVLGLEEFLEGTILSYINELGHVALGFEAGQHDNPASITNHEAIIWLSLHNCGCLHHDLPEPMVEHSYGVLAKTIVEGKKVFELRHRHPIESADQFKMKPGYVNFQQIKKNEQLAKDQDGVIKAKESGRIFMPLYQSQGDDGFFIVRNIKKFWLTISAILRVTQFHRFLHLLPGVGKYNQLNHTLAVNTFWARWYVVDFFHLMGFRKKQIIGKRMIFTKREYDIRRP